MKFGELRKYISVIDRVSICVKETLFYDNFEFISQVPERYNDYYVYGIGRIQSEFPDGSGGHKMGDGYIFKECIEIMLSETPREFK